jgi:hypothetical protein
MFKKYNYNKRVFTYCLLGCDIFALLCNFALGSVSCVQSSIFRANFSEYATIKYLTPLANLLNIIVVEAILSYLVGLLCGGYNIYRDASNIAEIQKDTVSQPVEVSNVNVEA